MEDAVENNNNNNIEEKTSEKRKATTNAVPLNEIKRLKQQDDTLYPQSPKKRLQLDTPSTSNHSKHHKNQSFMYGNYKHYYGKRILDKDFKDIRLDMLAGHAELFRDKQLLDIGCNSGHLSIEIAKKFQVKSLVGLDIDRSLVQEAQMAINSLKRQTTAHSQFPYNMKFVHGNYVLEDDVLLEIERAQFEVILCLSVTKWIHLNFCDAGLKQAFRRMFKQLKPGGKLILEPQSFDNYKRRKKLSDQIRENYNKIQFKPQDFTEYLLSSEVGFASMELMGVPEHCEAGFKRPIQIFTKTQEN